MNTPKHDAEIIAAKDNRAGDEQRFYERLSFALKKAFKDHKKSQKLFAETYGYEPAQVSAYLNGKRQPSIYFVKAVSEFLGMSTDDLLSENTITAKPKQHSTPITYRQLAEGLLRLIEQAKSSYVIEVQPNKYVIPPKVECGEPEYGERLELYIYNPQIVQFFSDRDKLIMFKATSSGMTDDILKQWQTGALAGIPDEAIIRWDYFRASRYVECCNDPGINDPDITNPSIIWKHINSWPEEKTNSAAEKSERIKEYVKDQIWRVFDFLSE